MCPGVRAQLAEQDLPCTENTTLDRTDSATDYSCRLVVGQTGYSNQEQRLPLANRHPAKGLRDFCSSGSECVWLAGELGGIVAVLSDLARRERIPQSMCWPIS